MADTTQATPDEALTEQEQAEQAQAEQAQAERKKAEQEAREKEQQERQERERAIAARNRFAQLVDQVRAGGTTEELEQASDGLRLIAQAVSARL